jgi:RNA polymerase sigma-70 factor, ECF subfamily
MKNKLQLHLIEKCINNDKKAQMQLYDLYCRAMFNTAYNFIKNDAIAQDIMQEAFIKAFKKIQTYSGEATFGAWLKKIVVNQSLDWLKKQKLETVDIDDHVISVVDYEDENWEIEKDTNLKAIYHSIDQLPKKCKNVVKLYLLEGYDHQEVAQILQISEIASRSQLSRGKNKLRELLTHRDYES